MMQIFNQFNARKLQEGELNVFSGILNNYLFLGVVFITFSIQMLMVEYGGKAIKTHPLNLSLNILCIALGSFELLWGLVVK